MAVAAATAALLVALPAGAAGSFAWVYAGHSVQLDPTSRIPFPATIELTQDGRAIDAVSFAERYTCPSGESFTDRITLTGMPIRSDGTWSKQRTFPGGVTVEIAGRLTQTAATFRVKATDNQQCTAETSYLLTHGPASYGGSSSDDFPVSIRLDHSRKAISELSVFLKASCRDPKGEPVSYRAPARLRDIALGGDGSFSRTSGYRYAFRGKGALVSVAYSVRGRVGPATATGTLSFVVSAAYPDGAKVFAGCKGRFTWKATSV